MPVYSYKAKKKGEASKIFEGEIEADSKKDAAARLIQTGYFPSSIDEQKQPFNPMAILGLADRFNRPTLEDLILFTSQMSTLFKAGLPLVATFDGLIDQASNPFLRRALDDIRSKVEDGAALNEAMKDYPTIFTETYTNMVAAGEATGNLDGALDRLADLMERQFETENRLKEVTRYPKLVVGSLVIAVTFLMSFVVPRFMNIFERAKLDLPLPTKILIAANTGFQNFWWLGLIIAVGAFVMFKQYTATTHGRYQLDKNILRIPVLGDVFVKITFAQFCNVMGNLLKSGIPILEAINISSRAAGNTYLQSIFTKVEESVREGSGMAEPMKGEKIIPPIVVQMVAAGESSGSLDDMMFKIASYFNEDADRNIKRLSSLIEPLLLFGLGAIVLFLALAIFLPMWDMSKMAGR